MNIKQIFDCFNQVTGHFPIEAVQSALQQREIIIPHLLNHLEETITHYQTVDAHHMAHIFAFYLLSRFREQSAFPYVINILSLPDEWPQYLLSDCLEQDVPRFIASTFNGDLSALQQVIENVTLSDASRSAALESLVALVATGQIKRMVIMNYLRSLFYGDLASNKVFLTHVADTATNLYPAEVLDKINQALATQKIDCAIFSEGLLRMIMSWGKTRALKEFVYQDVRLSPINDIEKDMSWMAGFGGRDHYDELEALFDELPQLGRNEPCYCGSGKKFKKCCLN